MVLSSSSVILSAVAIAACISCVQGHGYMLIPESQFTDSATSAWIVQIDPTWASDDWDGNTNQSVETYQTLAAENGVTNIRPLLDDTSLYGADCGFTDPDGTAQPIPTDSTATFSRAIQHVGPCEIWLDDSMVFHDDNCYADYGGEDVDVKSVFPVDYSQCETTGCSMMRFYWLAFQGVDDETVWQIYKDCIPLEGGSGSSNSTASVSLTSSTTDSSASTTSSATSSTTSSTATSATDDDLESGASSSAEGSTSTTDTPTASSSESSSTASGSSTGATSATASATSEESDESSTSASYASGTTSYESSASTESTSSDSSTSTEDEADESTTTTETSTVTTEEPATTTEAPATMTDVPSTTETTATSSATSSVTATPSTKCSVRDRKRV